MRNKLAKKLRQIAKNIVGSDEVAYDIVEHNKPVFGPDGKTYLVKKHQIKHNEKTWKSVYKVLKQGHTKRHNYA